jgi:hypothetical protein
MKSERIGQILMIGIFVLTSISCGGHSKERKAYEKLRSRIQGSELAGYPIDKEAAEFLEDARASWKIHKEEPIFPEILATAEFEVSASGVVSFCTHQLPEYSVSDPEQNLREGVRALTMAAALSQSLDGRVYFKEGLCFIRLSEKAVEVFEDEVQGLSRTLYVNLKKEDKFLGGK